ncbi:peptidase A1-like protein [Meyerozyma guilliermondii]
MGSRKGKVIFGGIDLAKIDGPLVDLLIIDEALSGVNMDSVTINGETITVNQKAVFDTGTTLVAFTPEVAKFVMSHYDNAQYHPEANVWTVDSDKNKDQIINLNFNGVSVPFKLTRSYFPNFLKNGINYGKVFRIRQFEFNLLGDIFLSNAYCVFNYDTNIVSLGLARHTTESIIVAI